MNANWIIKKIEHEIKRLESQKTSCESDYWYMRGGLEAFQHILALLTNEKS